MLACPLRLEARVVNMIRLGEAFTTEDAGVGGPPVKALFVYNSNPAAVAPNQNDVLRGMLREDLFTVVHEQFFTDTTDYADVVLPAATFLETKDVQGAYGHYYAQMSERAIEPLGEARNNVTMFGELAVRMGFTEACFRDREDELIAQAWTMDAPWVAGITRERLEREGHVAVQMPVNAAGDVLPFSTAEWFRTPSGRGELTPAPVFVAPVHPEVATQTVPPALMAAQATRGALTPRQQAQQALAAIDASYSGFAGGMGSGRFRNGTAGLDRLVDIETPAEASVVLARTVRFTAVAQPVFLNSGVLAGTGVAPLRTRRRHRTVAPRGRS